MEESIVCCISIISFVGKLCSIIQLRILKVKKSGQISCAHKRCFLMLLHKNDTQEAHEYLMNIIGKLMSVVHVHLS